MSFTKNFNKNIPILDIQRELNFAQEAIALYDEGIALQDSNSRASMKEFAVRVNSTLSTNSHEIGLESHSSDFFDVSDEKYIEESFGEVLSKIFQSVKEFILAMIERIKKYIGELRPFVALKKRKLEQWKKEDDQRWATFYKNQGFSKFPYTFEYNGVSPVAEVDHSHLDDLIPNADLVIRLIDSFEKSFNKNYHDYFDKLNELIYKFDKNPDAWQAFPLRRESAPMALRLTSVSELKKLGATPPDESSDNYYALKSERLPLGQIVVAFIGKDSTFHLGESPNVFDSEMSFINNTDAGAHWIVEAQVPDMIFTNQYFNKLESVLEKIEHYQKVIEVTYEDLGNLKTLLHNYEKTKDAGDESHGQAHDRKIASYLMKAIGTYNKFVIYPNAGIVNYTLRYIGVGHRVLKTISDARMKKLEEFKKVTNP